MEMLASLFLDSGFKIAGAEWAGSVARRRSGVVVRLYVKELEIDDGVMAFFDVNGADAERFRAQFRQSVESRKLFAVVTGRKVFLRIRKFFELEQTVVAGDDPAVDLLKREETAPNILRATYYRIGFQRDFEGGEVTGELYLNDKNIFSIAKTFAVDITGSGDDELDRIRRKFYRAVTKPPENFHDLLATLPDKSLQILLNAFLSKNIASCDMLASFIHSMGETRQKFLDNVSANVRREIYERLDGGGPVASYRWMRQVYYIIDRNAFRQAQEFGVAVPGLEEYADIRRNFENARATLDLTRKGIGGWLAEIDDEGNLPELVKLVRRQTLADALSFDGSFDGSFDEGGKAVESFSNQFSANGLKLLREDVEASRAKDTAIRIGSLTEFLRICREIVYTPKLDKLPFDETLEQTIRDAVALETVSDETGYATAVFALKSVKRREWLDRVMKGTFRTIYEDVAAGKLKVKDFDDYSIPGCRREFLKAALILSDEGKI